jgi:hypothetical protein
MKKNRLNLSKSLFIRGLQCHRSLYLDRYHPELRSVVPDGQQRVFTWTKGRPGQRDVVLLIPLCKFVVLVNVVAMRPAAQRTVIMNADSSSRILTMTG